MEVPRHLHFITEWKRTVMGKIRRIFVEKKPGYDVEARGILHDVENILGIRGVNNIRLINRYDIEGIDDSEYINARMTVFAEPPVDIVYDEELPVTDGNRVFAFEYLPGQFDQRADSCAQCIQLSSKKNRPMIKTAKVIVTEGCISDIEFSKIQEHLVNPVDSRIAALPKPETLEMNLDNPTEVEILHGFINMDENSRAAFMETHGLAMNPADLNFVQDYFRNTEKRDPTITEIRVIDTYWSDHCRHTTFLTELTDIDIEDSPYLKTAGKSLEEYRKARNFIYGESCEKPISLMDMATIAVKELRKQGKLDDLEVSDEINACSIVVDATVNGKTEEWLVMFKNETHNHPTEIEPFGGAATCLGGAIRDPLSGRAYVYQAMRVTGCADPRVDLSKTLPGKLPQIKITREAAHGYSSYGNQIGLATGKVQEIYNDGFLAKRMEIGAVIAAAPRENVKRLNSDPGDVIVLVGGRTGRDGCGGATGSSKEHTEESLGSCGAEVQKGNPPTERKLQRLFRNPEASRLIKKCNDFGAGGVAVAIGELADGLAIDLDAVQKKYEGLDGTELAISESQERMAVVLDPEDVDTFVELAETENLESSIVAKVNDSGRLRMRWMGKTIVDVSRFFLDTNGVTQKTTVRVVSPDEITFLEKKDSRKLIDWMKGLNACSQKGLAERFDSTIGAGTILMPFGGKYQMTPQEGMAAKLPVMCGDTETATLMSFGYNPDIALWSPFHGACYAVLESVSAVAAMGGEIERIRLTFQEYFEKLGNSPERWGKPAAALLGAYHAQKSLGIAAIGGKDSMSGTFGDLDVPPTLVSFAVCPVNARNVVSAEFKEAGNDVVLVDVPLDNECLPDFEEMKENYALFLKLVEEGQVLAAKSIRSGGIAEAAALMCMGNGIGFGICEDINEDILYKPGYGRIIAEVKGTTPFAVIGKTTNESNLVLKNDAFEIDAIEKVWSGTLENVFPVKTTERQVLPKDKIYNSSKRQIKKSFNGRPRVIIPVFPGTNCEYDSARAFERAGGIVKTMIFRNLTPNDVHESVEKLHELIDKSNILMIPGGFSAGDEPEGSGKFIANVFRNKYLEEAVMKLLEERDGLVLGICNGFQALIKLGLLPYGEIRPMEPDSPTLTFNEIGRHVSCMVNTRISSDLSPWLSLVNTGDIHTIPVSHGEGRFVADKVHFDEMFNNGQIATQYVDFKGNPIYDIRFNPNGSMHAVEGITSPDGRVFGKMGHSERIGSYVGINVPGEKDQKIFEAGVRYFK